MYHPAYVTHLSCVLILNGLHYNDTVVAINVLFFLFSANTPTFFFSPLQVASSLLPTPINFSVTGHLFMLNSKINKKRIYFVIFIFTVLQVN